MTLCPKIAFHSFLYMILVSLSIDAMEQKVLDKGLNDAVRVKRERDDKKDNGDQGLVSVKQEKVSLRDDVYSAQQSRANLQRSMLAHDTIVGRSAGRDVAPPPKLLVAPQVVQTTSLRMKLPGVKISQAAAKSANKEPALISAIQEGEKDQAILLIERGADPNVYSSTGKTALGLAIELGHDDVVKALLDHGVYKNEFSQKEPPLVLALIHNRQESFQMLLSAGADLEALSNTSWSFKQVSLENRSTALQIAAAKGDIFFMRALLRAGARLYTHQSKWSEISLAVRGGHQECVRALFDASTDKRRAAQEICDVAAVDWIAPGLVEHYYQYCCQRKPEIKYLVDGAVVIGPGELRQISSHLQMMGREPISLRVTRVQWDKLSCCIPHIIAFYHMDQIYRKHNSQDVRGLSDRLSTPHCLAWRERIARELAQQCSIEEIKNLQVALEYLGIPFIDAFLRDALVKVVARVVATSASHLRGAARKDFLSSLMNQFK